MFVKWKIEISLERDRDKRKGIGGKTQEKRARRQVIHSVSQSDRYIDRDRHTTEN